MTRPEAPGVADWLRLTEALQSLPGAGDLSPIGAGILAALSLGIGKDSRSFARDFGIAHALVLREETELVERGLISILRRDARTQRGFWALSPAGEAAIGRALSSPDPSL